MKELNQDSIRSDFTILSQNASKPLIYFDHAATSQKPKQVLDAILSFYQEYNANVHRGTYQLSGQATFAYEASRKKVAQFIGASSEKEIIFTKGTTDSINQIAYMLTPYLSENDEILISKIEHHSNIIPWQEVAKKTGASLKYIDLTSDGYIDFDDYKKKINEQTKILAIQHASNVLGTIHPIGEMIQYAKRFPTITIIDGAQAVGHFPVDVADLDADFYAFSGHKIFGPTGIGVLYGKRDLLEEIEPVVFGGEMIAEVSEFYSTWADLPQKFEAGTPNIAGAIGLSAAIEYVQSIGFERIQMIEKELTKYFLDHSLELEGFELYGPKLSGQRLPIFSFNLDSIHPHDLATVLDMDNIAVRAGHHCAQILMRVLGTTATTRVSLNFTNTKEEIDQFITSLKKAKEYFQ